MGKSPALLHLHKRVRAAIKSSRRRAGRCQMQMRCSGKDAESMDSLGKAWLDKSFPVLLQRDMVGRRQESYSPLTPEAGRLQPESWEGITAHPQSCHLHSAAPHHEPKPCMVQRLRAQAPWGSVLSPL